MTDAAAWTLALQAINLLLVPAVLKAAGLLWRLDRRLYAVEVKLGMHKRVSDE